MTSVTVLRFNGNTPLCMPACNGCSAIPWYKSGTRLNGIETRLSALYLITMPGIKTEIIIHFSCTIIDNLREKGMERIKEKV